MNTEELSQARLRLYHKKSDYFDKKAELEKLFNEIVEEECILKRKEKEERKHANRSKGV